MFDEAKRTGRQLRPRITRSGAIVAFLGANGMFRLLALLVGFALTSCSLPSIGPSRSEITDAAKPNQSGGARFALVDLSPTVVANLDNGGAASLQATFGVQQPLRIQTIGLGDYLQIVVWEASAGGLFSGTSSGDRVSSSGSRSAMIPEQVVGADGAITVPYAGRILVVGRTPSQVEASIVERLQGKALEPQALVTVTKNIANTVSVLGEVTTGARVPLSGRGDRILDVVAAAGGTKAPAYETFLTLIRGSQSVRVPMQALLMSPKENVYVMPGDVITVAREPQTFTAIGATGKNEVLPFDAIGLSLDQAIGKAGGLNDQRADPGGVFVVRFEAPDSYDKLGVARPIAAPVGEIPVIFRLDMHDPNAFFFARRFAIHNKDILFVSNAPATDLQKVGAIISTFLGPAATIVAVGAVAKNY